jgi:hypothetical protein
LPADPRAQKDGKPLDYSKIDVPEQPCEDFRNLQQTALYQVVKSIKGLVKVLAMRQENQVATDLLSSVQDFLAKIIGTKETYVHADLMMGLSRLHLELTDLQGRPVYDPQDRPLTFALQA